MSRKRSIMIIAVTFVPLRAQQNEAHARGGVASTRCVGERFP